jgi:hypothetical protein
MVKLNKNEEPDGRRTLVDATPKTAASGAGTTRCELWNAKRAHIPISHRQPRPMLRQLRYHSSQMLIAMARQGPHLEQNPTRLSLRRVA